MLTIQKLKTTSLCWALLFSVALIGPGVAAQDTAAADAQLAQIRDELENVWGNYVDVPDYSDDDAIADFTRLVGSIDQLFVLDPNIPQRDPQAYKGMLLCDAYNGIATVSLSRGDMDTAQRNIESCIQQMNEMGVDLAMTSPSITYVFITMSQYLFQQGLRDELQGVLGNLVAALFATLPHVETQEWLELAEGAIFEHSSNASSIIREYARSTNPQEGRYLLGLLETQLGSLFGNATAAIVNGSITRAKKLAALQIAFGGIADLPSDNADANLEVLLGVRSAPFLAAAFSAGLLQDMTDTSDDEMRADLIENVIMNTIAAMDSEDFSGYRFGNWNELANANAQLFRDQSKRVASDFSVNAFQIYMTDKFFSPVLSSAGMFRGMASALSSLDDDMPAPEEEEPLQAQPDDPLYFSEMKAHWSKVISDSVTVEEMEDWAIGKMRQNLDCIVFYQAENGGRATSKLLATMPNVVRGNQSLNWHELTLFPSHNLMMLTAVSELLGNNLVAPYINYMQTQLPQRLEEESKKRSDQYERALERERQNPSNNPFALEYMDVSGTDRKCSPLIRDYRSYDASVLATLAG